MTTVGVILILVAVAGLLLVLAPMAIAWRKARGVRLITCPETHEPEAVEIDAAGAAFGAALGSRELWLKSCTRWPERQGCGQDCLAQIAAAPHGCRVRTLLADWYRGQSCVLCGKPFEETPAWDHKPAVIRLEDRTTFEWSELRAEELPELLKTYLPVCWDCHIIECLYREHPELIVERPNRPKRYTAACLAVALLASLWLTGCARQEAPAATAAAPAVSAAQVNLAAETAAIRQALHRYVEEHGEAAAPEEDVAMAEVAIDSGYALVTWTHEAEGGQAVLQKQAGAWKVIKCGPGWLGLRGVCRQDVPDDVAKRLLDGIDPNWPSYETF